MKIPIYQIDAFTGKLFGGNPAAVCPLKKWLPEKVMQNIAAENNLSETAFFVKTKDRYHIRWFTPETEVKLCGHATLATAHLIFNHLRYRKPAIFFDCLSGELKAVRKRNLITLDFPAKQAVLITPPPGLAEGLGKEPNQVFKAFDTMAIYDTEEDILALDPDFAALKKVDCRGIIVTAPGRKSDFVSRFFAPSVGINEDPVTGSAHTILIPYWAKRLNKNRLHAYQLSRRVGELFCENRGERVLFSGRAVTFMKGVISI